MDAGCGVQFGAVVARPGPERLDCEMPADLQPTTGRRPRGIAMLWYSAAIVGCASIPPTYAAFYELQLVSVERSAEPARSTPAGGSVGEILQETGAFRDDRIEIGVTSDRGAFLLTLQNRTAGELAVDWDRAFQIGSDGALSRLVKGRLEVIRGRTEVNRDADDGSTTVLGPYAGVSQWVIPLRDDSAKADGALESASSRASGAGTKLRGGEFRLIVPVQDGPSSVTYALRLELQGVILNYREGVDSGLQLPGAPYAVPLGATHIRRWSVRTAFPLVPECTAWFEIPQDEAIFYVGEETVRRQAISIVDRSVCGTHEGGR